MKDISPALAAHLQSGATTLANCWILRRTDQVAIGFTDHDEALLLNGVSCEPATGMSGSEMRQSSGFASDDQDVSGILNSDRMSEADLISGRYDGASVETWRVNWQDTSQSILLRTGYLGEVRREGQSFSVEIRGLSVALEQERGRLYQYRCDAVFGDNRCGLDLTRADLGFEGAVSKIVSPTEIEILASQRPSLGRLTHGQLAMKSGQATAMTFDILSHRADDEKESLELWLPMHTGIAVGDEVRMTIGCNKCFATCRDLFANQKNYRGFPHIPGNDYLLSPPDQHPSRDGSAIVRE